MKKIPLFLILFLSLFATSPTPPTSFSAETTTQTNAPQKENQEEPIEEFNQEELMEETKQEEDLQPQEDPEQQEEQISITEDENESSNTENEQNTTLKEALEHNHSSSSLKIALMMPKKIIGRYSSSTIDTVLSYLSTRGGDFELEVFDSKDEREESIIETYESIQEGEFNFVIAIFTTLGAQALADLNVEIPTYIPTVHSSQIDFDPSTSTLLFFGGIDYGEQISKLLKFQNSNKIISYNDDSPIGERLGEILYDQVDIFSEQVITNEIAATFSKNAKTQEALIEKANVFLNTPVIKSGLLLSQIGYFKKKASAFFSTQLNYSPSIIILTQRRDRKNLYIANSIGTTDQKLIEYASLLNSDLKFDWVNYSTALGMEYFYRILFPESSSFFQESLQNNQAQYATQIYSIDDKGFYPIPLPQEEQSLEKDQAQKDQ